MLCCCQYNSKINTNLTLFFFFLGKIGKRFSIIIHTKTPEGYFKYGRYSPLKSNIRSNWFDDIEQGTVDEIGMDYFYLTFHILKLRTYKKKKKIILLCSDLI